VSAEVEAGSADDATAVINYAGGRFAFRRNRELQCGGILFELELFSLKYAPMKATSFHCRCSLADATVAPRATEPVVRGVFNASAQDERILHKDGLR